MLLKIHHALNEGKDYYEATRGNWKISESRLDYIQYVVGFNRGKVACVFQPTRWGVIEEGEEKGRKYFEGLEASVELLSKLQNAEKNLLGKFGSGNPVAYAFISDIE